MPRWGTPKYRPLAAYLAAQPADVAEVTLTLAELERVVGAPLSRGVAERAWWANMRRMPSSQSRAWLGAGWRVDALALRADPPIVTFVRDA